MGNSEIVMLFTVQGQMIGELLSDPEYGDVELRNPALVVNQGTSVSFFPILQFVTDKTVKISRDKLLFGTIHTPVEKMQDEYRELFGAGIKVVSQMPRIAMP